MYLKDFIHELIEIYQAYPEEYKAIVGEPEIVIETFNKLYSKTIPYLYQFKGIRPEIDIKRSPEGSFLVLSAITNPNETRLDKKPDPPKERV